MGEKEANISRKSVQILEINEHPRINLPALRGMFTNGLRSMCETEASKSKKSAQTLELNERPRINLPAIRGFLSQFPGKFQRHLKSRFKRPTEKEGANREMFKLNDPKFNLDMQMQAWKKNPVWDDGQPSIIEVVVPKGSLCELKVKTNVGLPPDAIYNIVTDPANRRVFKNIQEVTSRKVLLDEGSRQVVDLEQAAIWRFLWWSGTISVHVLVDQNREDYSDIPGSKNSQVFPSKELEMTKFQESIKLPVDVTDVWEIDLKLLKFEYRICGGSYGDLYKGIFCAQDVAIKALKEEYLNENAQREFAQEVYIMRKVRHKNVVQFIGACTRPPNLCIITEFMAGGSVYDFLHNQGGQFDVPTILKIGIHVSKGMNYLHENNIIHRDLKSANLLMDENGGGATHVDIACDPELVKLVTSLTRLPVCVSSVDPSAFLAAVEAGASMVEIGNYDSFYDAGIVFSPEQGMGEPLNNYTGLVEAIRVMTAYPFQISPKNGHNMWQISFSGLEL